MKAVDLRLHGNLAIEWEDYITKLYDVGVYIGEGEDNLQWEGATKKGQLRVKDIYNSLPLVER